MANVCSGLIDTIPAIDFICNKQGNIADLSSKILSSNNTEERMEVFLQSINVDAMFSLCGPY